MLLKYIPNILNDIQPAEATQIGVWKLCRAGLLREAKWQIR